eukprot:UC4_evm1s217
MLERGTGPYGSILLGQNGRGYVLGPNENGTDSVRPIPWSGSDINDLFVGDLFFTTADMELRVLEENDEKSKIIEETKRKDGSRPIPHFSTAGTLIYESETA